MYNIIYNLISDFSKNPRQSCSFACGRHAYELSYDSFDDTIALFDRTSYETIEFPARSISSIVNYVISNQ